MNLLPFICSSCFNGYWRCFQFLPVTGNIAMDTLLQVFFLKDFSFLMWAIFKVFTEFVIILLLLYVLFFLVLRHVRSQLLDKGLNPFHWNHHRTTRKVPTLIHIFYRHRCIFCWSCVQDCWLQGMYLFTFDRRCHSFLKWLCKITFP